MSVTWRDQLAKLPINFQNYIQIIVFAHKVQIIRLINFNIYHENKKVISRNGNSY